MAFCTNCGNKMPDDSRFCAGCGAQIGAPAPGAQAGFAQTGQGGGWGAAASGTPLDYTIQGDNLQVARVRLKSGQEIYAEAGKMLYKTTNVMWETRMQGDSLGQKIWGAIKRKLIR